MKSNCTKCGDLLIENINWTTGSLKKKMYQCSSCRNKYQRENHANNKSKRNEKQRERYKRNKSTILKQQKEKYVQSTFNLSVEEYDEYFKDSSCNVCSKPTDLVLDHCHNTGRIRGVLCRQCNMAIGLLGDNFAGVKKAMEYLNEDN